MELLCNFLKNQVIRYMVKENGNLFIFLFFDPSSMNMMQMRAILIFLNYQNIDCQKLMSVCLVYFLSFWVCFCHFIIIYLLNVFLICHHVKKVNL